MLTLEPVVDVQVLKKTQLGRKDFSLKDQSINSRLQWLGISHGVSVGRV